MAFTLFKWLGFAAFSFLHPFYVSVAEINYNSTEKTLEISCKIFTDDLEKVLTQNHKIKVDVINPNDDKTLNAMISDYFKSHLQIKTGGRIAPLQYLGYETEEGSLYGYFQADNITDASRIEVTNTILHDFIDKQVNIMHVRVNGNRKSTKLDYPQKNAVFDF